MLMYYRYYGPMSEARIRAGRRGPDCEGINLQKVVKRDRAQGREQSQYVEARAAVVRV